MKALFARHRLDIHASHLAFALSTMAEAHADRAAIDVERVWSPAGEALACLSVRSSFHLLLSTLAFPRGSEVLFSAVTHPDMPRLAEHHGLRVLPVDLDRDTLAPRPELVLRALTPKTRMVVVAHLFGGRIDLSPLAEICRRNKMLLVEDCAQAFRGPEHTGDPLADVSLFSFGSLKTATALGGALATVRNADLLSRMRQVQAGWPVQRRRSHIERVVQMAAFVTLTRPLPYALMASAYALARADFDRAVNSSARAFPAGPAADLVERLERRPCAPLLHLLAHRISHFDHGRIAARAAAGDRLAAMLPGGLHVGGAALDHTHWLFPVTAGDRDRVIAAARAAGFDAARRASSVGAIEAPADRPDLEPCEAKGFMSGLVFLPAYPELPDGSLEKLAHAILGEVLEGVHPHPTLPLKGEGTARDHSALSGRGRGQVMRESRARALDLLGHEVQDVLVIGGGIVGARTAFEAARSGLRVALVDAGDFGGGSSSASSKLIHGGFRYLPMGDIGLIRQSQRERQLLLERIAPNLVRRLPFLLPVYEGASRGPATIAAGLMLYRGLAGRGGRVDLLGAHGAQALVPQIRTSGLRMSGVFEEAETIDARLVLSTVKAAAGCGALVLNHARVIGLELRHNRAGAVAIDCGDGVVEARARHVVNAAGPWVDQVRTLDEPGAAPLVRLSKGVHLLVPMEEGWQAGVALPLSEGRVALGIPWQGMLMLGTTDTLFIGDPSSVRVTPDDTRVVLEEAAGYLPADLLHPRRVRFQVAGLRALPIAEGDTAAARRGHLIETSETGLVSVAGGKLTTHRLIALDVLRRLQEPRLSGLEPDATRLPGTGWDRRVDGHAGIDPEVSDHLQRLYGDEAGDVVALGASLPDGLERIHPSGPDIWAQAVFALEREWAGTVDDIARRRTTLAVRGLLTESAENHLAALVGGTAIRAF